MKQWDNISRLRMVYDKDAPVLLNEYRIAHHDFLWYCNDTEKNWNDWVDGKKDDTFAFGHAASKYYKDDPVKYENNQYGYRGGWRIYPDSIWSFGCSNTYGLGLHQEDIWCERVAEMMKTPLLNFGIPAGCFEMIAHNLRSLLKTDLTPLYVLIQVPSNKRTVNVYRHDQNISLIPQIPQTMDTTDYIEAIFRSYTAMQEVKDMLEQRGIPYLMWGFNQEHDNTVFPLDFLQFSVTFDEKESYLDQFIEGDFSRDGQHLGRNTHEQVAQVLHDLIINPDKMEEYKNRYMVAAAHYRGHTDFEYY